MPITNERSNVRTYPTPNLRDVLFFEVRDEDFPKNKNREYGQPHPDSVRWPNHKLVYVEMAQDGSGDVEKFRWWYAADREHQDDYNWKLSDGKELVRFYVIPRELYFARTEAEAATASPNVANEFTCPVAAEPDARFPKFGFVGDSIMDAEVQIGNLYVIIQRRFIEPFTQEVVWSQEFERNILVTREVIPKNIVSPTQSAGLSIEIQPGNIFHDVKITQRVLGSDINTPPTYPYVKTITPGYADFQFPPKLESAEIVWAYAYADSDSAAASYDEEYYFKWKVIEPRPGPYPATVTRYITNNPAALATLYPLDVIPPAIRESFGIVGAWFRASQKGNSTSATAKEVEVPKSIHPVISIELAGVSGSAVSGSSRNRTPTLAETPGYGTFIGKTSFRIGYESRPLGFGLYEVAITTIVVGSLYT